jgi:hypothetical protein
MGFSEKDPNDAAKTASTPPKLDAILPDETPTAAAELVDDITTTQRRMEKEWETAKNSYEKKINNIMNEFIGEGLSKFNADRPASDEPIAAAPVRNAGETQLQDLIQQLEKELRGVRYTPSRQSEFLSREAPASLQLGWNNPTPGLVQKLKIAAMSAVLLLLFGLSFWASQWRVLQTPLPYAHTIGPVVADGNIYIMDWFRKILFVHKNNSALTITSVEAMPNNLATGIAMSEKTVWTLDGLDLKLNLHTPTVDHQVTSSIAAPDTHPVGLYFDGTDLWSADQDAYKLLRHRGNDVEEIRDTVPLPDSTITSFLLNKTQLWILDGKSRLITVYRLQKPLLKLAAYDLDPLVKQAAPSGMAIDGNTLLVVTENPASLLRIPLFRLRHSHLKTSE